MRSVFQTVRNTFKRKPRSLRMQRFVDEEKQHNKTDPSINIKVNDLEENFNCRICQDVGEPDQEVCIPCECTGSIRHVHVDCLKEWIKQKQSLECEICHKPYKNKWKIWAYENKIVKGLEGAPELTEKESVWVKLVPMIIFTFFFYSLIVFLLNTKVPHQHNKYYPLVLVFRGIVYFLIALLVILSWRYLKNDSSFEEKEKEAIEELKRKVARFIRD